ncbi:Glycoside hydrolase, superfamily [Penicillium italicum]|uniref:chitinase n=1 Tax=Penicillium italicum TaxID=40296 RepID=A0A0A2KZJ1_PENIT|nr:Glycoside hydrolase, superfamily [Penicillium italicum]
MATTAVATKIRARAECRAVQVDYGNGCPELAAKCGISAADFTKYNPASDFCSKLKPKQHVCCSQGILPDFSPKPNADGSCYAYKVKDNDNCDDLAAEWSLTRQDLEDFNKNTWGWNGCTPMYSKTVMCLSKGTAPFPAEIANAQCGPQKPGSKPPTDGSDISDLNPCPLNACCNVWGQCGITRDFCIDTNTGPPGTAKEGTYGCISNCGMDVVKGSGSGAIQVAYYEGYNMKRDCLFQDASQIDTSKFTHVHFGFGTLTPSFDVETGDVLSSYNFGQFKKLYDVKRILSFGGWDFSTMPDTYQIFRNGVKPANRLAMAQKIATFIKDNNLDGVDIDWEYPSATDLPENDPGSKEDGPNYLAFLIVLKNLLPGKSVSIAAPASYCQVNLTETRQSLAMITKAGVPGNKVVVGVTSYGRSFKMAEAGCYGPSCLYTGDRLNSNAKKGKCTGTAGYIADAEIAEILNNPKRSVTQHFVDSSSNSDILVYDDTEYVSYMSAATKATRAALYKAWGLGGTSDWASDLQTYNEVPKPAKSWDAFFKRVLDGEDPEVDDTRNGNWTEFNCDHEMTVHPTAYLPSPDYYDTLFHASVIATTALDDLDNKFAPIPPAKDNTWLLPLIDLLALGTLGTAGPFFNTVLNKLPYFLEKSSTLDNFKDTTMTMVGQGTTIAKDLLPSDDPNSRWNPQSQDTFSNYMGQVVDGWANVSSLSLEQLFDGKPKSIKTLGEIISNGKLVDGKFEQEPSKDDEATDINDLRTNIQKCFFGYSIPALWQASKAYAFIIDAGYACGGKEPTDYLADDTMDATGACVDGQQYYLVYPDGDATVCKRYCSDHGPCSQACSDNKFSAPPGLDSLKGGNFGGISKSDLVKGSVRTWKQNGKTNGGGYADPTDQDTINSLLNVDVTTPGFMRIPVCSPERAYQSWDTAKAGSSDNYPCDIPPGRNTCGDSTFGNETSDGSPLVEDCLTIIKNIQGDASTRYTTLVVGKNQREIAAHGTCAFGVQATKVDGNANFVTGGQDVIDIINESVKRFASNGKVGAKGNMNCNGNVKSEPVLWGIYST